MRSVGLYVHFPFCVQKCAYCDFPSFSGLEEAMPAYAQALKNEMRVWAAREDFRVETMYLGGGTPSIFPPALMGEVLSEARRLFSFAPEAECTCECNPGTVEPEFLSVLRENGVNRLSLGAQASQPRLLRALGRIHSWPQVADAVRLSREAGFHNLNLDLMLGLPGQTAADAAETLAAALALSPTHLSCYGLIVEEGTPLAARVQAGEWALPDEEIERAEYELCRETLARHGFAQYEISNFALPSYACRHNLDCWSRKEYLGVGSAACGFLGNQRYRNAPDPRAYLRGEPPEIMPLSPEDARFESVMLGLRTMRGVSEKEFARAHGVSLQAVYGKKLEKSLASGLVVWEDGFLRLTRRGMDLQNRVLVDLL